MAASRRSRRDAPPPGPEIARSIRYARFSTTCVIRSLPRSRVLRNLRCAPQLFRRGQPCSGWSLT